jgi:hypothetical protein
VVTSTGYNFSLYPTTTVAELFIGFIHSHVAALTTQAGLEVG